MIDARRAACPYCGEAQSYDEATPGKPILSAPRQEYEKVGRRYVMRTVRDTYWHTHCRGCGERLIWSCTMYPSSVVRWRKPEQSESLVAGVR